MASSLWNRVTGDYNYMYIALIFSIQRTPDCSLSIRPSYGAREEEIPFSLPFFPFSPETPDTQAKKTEVLTLLIVWTISGFFFIISGLISISESWVIIFKHFGTSYRTKEINTIIKDYRLKQIQTMVSSLSLTAWYMLFYFNNLNKLSLKQLFFQVRDKLKVAHSGKWKALLLIYILFFLASIQCLSLSNLIHFIYFLSYLGFHCFAP